MISTFFAEYYYPLATGTDGIVVPYQELVPQPSMLSSEPAKPALDSAREALTAAMEHIINRPVALLANPEYIANPGESIRFDASASYVVDSEISEVAWDFDGDGAYDRLGAELVVEHTYPDAFDGEVRVRVRAANGTFTVANAPVHIGTYIAPVKPGSPTPLELGAAESGDSIRLSWEPQDQLAAQWLIAVNGVNLGVTDGDLQSVRISDIDRAAATELSVAGVTAAGLVGEAATITLGPANDAGAGPAAEEIAVTGSDATLSFIPGLVFLLLGTLLVISAQVVIRRHRA
ncbi:PKD domain-containing protein [Salinibacterium sp. SYSU T00001]|uniref:PKD domain-containing protein n=1 Tax=Homoserinimonas sedimenticola TaxID=2986805 RepID=UPI0022360D5E|nr:PKD domain-containing protein [Salinibacterium sedimenticola]MCW4385833.1 PKD domain-containing protein [Salinibacterium sedimenticola]